MSVLLPIKSMRARYVPLLAVYFSVGFSAIASVTNTFFFKNAVSLSAEDLVSLSIWIGLPWSIKMVFGALIDGIPILGNRRKSYIFLGNAMIALGTLGMIDHASSRHLIGAFGEYTGLLLSGLMATVGVVISDIVADTMAIEVVEEGPDKIQELGMIQVLARLALSIGAVAAASVTGWLAANLEPQTVYTLTLVCPAIAIIATALVRLEPVQSAPQVKGKILLGGLLYGVLCVAAGMFLGDYSQEVIFVLALGIIGYMMRDVLGEIPEEARKTFVMSMIAIFLFRVVPGVGPSGQWFYIDHLGFDAEFLGTLSIIAAVSSMSVLWMLAGSITRHSIFNTMSVLIILATVLSLPDILVFYGIHEMIGVSARSLVLMDTAMIAPIGQLAMIPLGVLVARNAPDNTRAVYISLTASLMNIALVGGDLITKVLNRVFVVTRTDFTQLGNLMIASLTISTVLSIIGLVVLRRRS